MEYLVLVFNWAEVEDGVLRLSSSGGVLFAQINKFILFTYFFIIAQSTILSDFSFENLTMLKPAI